MRRQGIRFARAGMAGLSVLALVWGVVVGGVSAAGTSPTAPDGGAGRPSLYNPSAADRWFVDQRLGQAKVVPQGAYSRAVQEARTLPVLRPSPGGVDPAAVTGAGHGTWINLGPSPIVGEYWSPKAASGRVSSITLSTNGTIYLGAAGGGVWSSTDGGQAWTPLTDNQPSLAMGDVAVAPSNPDVIYAGTGEAHQSADSFYGEGILKSTDGGKTWSDVGGEIFSGHHISRVLVDPSNPDDVYAADGVGLWNSTDGGASWNVLLGGRVTDALLVGGALYAAVEDRGVWESADGGDSWTLLSGGLPTGDFFGVTSLAVDPSDASTLYASIASDNSSDYGALTGVFKSTNGGKTWADLSAVPDYFQQSFTYGFGEARQGWYDNVIAVDPVDPSIVVAGGIGISVSTDGGKTWSGDISQPDGIHPDQHALTFDASGNLYVGNDGGIWEISTAGLQAQDGSGVSDLNTNLSITQFYPGMSVNGSTVMAGSQDNGTAIYTGTPAWQGTLSGDSSFMVTDPTNPDLVYGESNDGLYLSTDGGATWDYNTPITPPYRNANWVAPFILDPTSTESLLFGADGIYVSRDQGREWSEVDTPPKADDMVSALAFAPGDPNTVYAGWNDGTISVSNDGGQTWNEMALGSLRQWITSLTVSPTDPGTLYATLSGSFPQSETASPDVVEIAGANTASPVLTDLTANLPEAPVNDLALNGYELIVASDVGVFASLNGGQSWSALGTGLPNTQVEDLKIADGVLYAATHGRGVWEIPVGATVAPPTVITSVTPDAGLVSVGTPVVIRGSGFTGATAVTFGGVMARSFQVVSESEIDAVTPAGVPGEVEVQVTGTGGISAPSPSGTYIYSTPALASLTPDSGRPGDPILASGAGFGTVTGSVYFLQNGATVDGSVYGWSDESVEATVPAALTPGTVAVSVYTPAGVYSNPVDFTIENEPATVTVAGTAQVQAGTRGIIAGHVADAQGNAVAGIAVHLSISAGSIDNGTVVTGSDGSFTDSFVASTVVGTATVTASAVNSDTGQDVTGTFNSDVVPATPPNITIAAPTTVSAGTTIGVTGTVTDPYGNAIRGAQVDLTASSGTLTSATAITRADGSYSDSVTLPTKTQDVTITARVDGTSATVAETTAVTAASAGGITLTGPGSVTAGGTAVLSGTVTDAYDNVVAGAQIDLSASGGTVPAQVTSAGNGTYQVDLTAPTQAGNVTVTATVGGTKVSTTDTLAVVAASPANVTLSAPSSASAGSSVSVSGIVADAYGNPVAGVTVDLAASGGAIDASAQTGTGGTFSANFVAPAAAGNVTLTATVGGTKVSATDTLAVVAASPANLALSAPSSVAAGSSTSVAGTVTDAYGNPVAGVTVDLAASGGTVDASARTGTDGTFSANFVAPAVAGNVTLTATIANTTVQGTATVSVIAPNTGGSTGGSPGGSTGGAGVGTLLATTTEPTPGTTSATVNASQTTTLTLDGVHLVLPAGSLPSGTQVTISESDTSSTALPASLTLSSKVYTIDTGGTEPNASVTLTLTFSLPSGVSPEQLGLYTLQNGQWQFYTGGQIDTANDTLTANVGHLSTWAIMANARTYSDVPTGSWAFRAINDLTAAGLASGYPDGTFRPSATVTRAEFLKLLLGALGITPQVGASQPFSDVSASAWYSGYVDAAYADGVLKGIGGKALPDATVTREQAVVLLMRGLAWAHLVPGVGAAPANPLTFTDQASIASWALPDVQHATQVGLTKGYPNGTFQPLARLTRAESAALADRVFALRQNGVQPPPA